MSTENLFSWTSCMAHEVNPTLFTVLGYWQSIIISYRIIFHWHYWNILILLKSSYTATLTDLLTCSLILMFRHFRNNTLMKHKLKLKFLTSIFQEKSQKVKFLISFQDDNLSVLECSGTALSELVLYFGLKLIIGFRFWANKAHGGQWNFLHLLYLKLSFISYICFYSSTQTNI